MATLTADGATQYAAQGYLVVERLLSADETGAIRERVRQVCAGIGPDYPPGDIELEPGATVRSERSVRKLNRCAANDETFAAHARDPRILDLVESLIGPDIKLYDAQCFVKPPGGVEKPFHQDSAYFAVQPMDLVTCWTALDDVTLENGPMWVIPGSHLEGLVDHGEEWRVGDRADKRVPAALTGQRADVPIAMPAGSCSFHHSLLLHRSGANRSTSFRRGLAVHYMPATARWTDPTRAQPAYPLLRGREHVGCV